jgi:hypothetical protein
MNHLEGSEIDTRAIQRFKCLMTKSKLVENLHHLTTDTDNTLLELDTSKPIDPFDVMYRLVYQLTHRALGSNDVANNPKLLRETLAIYNCMNDSSAFQIMFPMLPTPGKLTKMWAGAKLHWAFQKIIRDRRKTGRKEADAMQVMMDEGDSDIQISAVSSALRTISKSNWLSNSYCSSLLSAAFSPDSLTVASMPPGSYAILRGTDTGIIQHKLKLMPY